MSLSIVKKLVSYRSWILAVINAAITWIILIIAPLGLFAVISCTLGVFISSLSVGWVCDRALMRLLRQINRDVMQASTESDGFDGVFSSQLDVDFLPRRRGN